MQTNTSLVHITPAPAEELPAEDFELFVNGQAVFTHRARVSAYPVNQYCPAQQRPLEQTEIASFASWDMAGPVAVEVRSRIPVESARVRPTAAGIVPTVDGDALRFTLDRPGQYTVEVNGYHQALHLFADPPETDIPDADAPEVLYFGPGVHCPGQIRMQSGQTLYLAAGAVVYGAILAEGVRDLAILGRGILDGSKFAREALTGLVCLYDCENVRIEGITLRDAGVFTVMPMACREVHLRRVKIIGNWRYNSDGIDFSNCRHCSVEDSFVRTFDDAICVKGYETFGPFLYRLRLVDGPMDGRFTVDGVAGTFAELQRRFGCYPCPVDRCDHITVRRCVIWCDWGRPLEVGAETVADEIHHLLFEDCDLIHAPGCCAILSVQNCDRARCRDIAYRNLRIELDDALPRPVIVRRPGEPYRAVYDGYLPVLIKLGIQVGYVSFDTCRGSIEDISFRDIWVTAPTMPPSRLIGHDATHNVRRITIENLRLNGQAVPDLASANIEKNAFVHEVELRTGGSQ